MAEDETVRTTEHWLVRNALQLVVALLAAVFGWSVNATLAGIADDIAANTVRLKRAVVLAVCLRLLSRTVPWPPATRRGAPSSLGRPRLSG